MKKLALTALITTTSFTASAGWFSNEQDDISEMMGVMQACVLFEQVESTPASYADLSTLVESRYDHEQIFKRVSAETLIKLKHGTMATSECRTNEQRALEFLTSI
ncbi:hypothetical protein L4D11_11535 [Vibrio gigantis]|uniref:hypothetical protein n=1 Tax=Vibrio gigantis TaxID=296199 RepID=UPI003D0F704B